MNWTGKHWIAAIAGAVGGVAMGWGASAIMEQPLLASGVLWGGMLLWVPGLIMGFKDKGKLIPGFCTTPWFLTLTAGILGLQGKGIFADAGLILVVLAVLMVPLFIYAHRDVQKRINLDE